MLADEDNRHRQMLAALGVEDPYLLDSVLEQIEQQATPSDRYAQVTRFAAEAGGELADASQDR